MKIVKQRQLTPCLPTVPKPGRQPFACVCQIPGHGILTPPHRIHHPTAACNKIHGPLQHNSHLSKILKPEHTALSGPADPPGRVDADARYFKQCIIIGPVDLHRKMLQMAHRPVTLGIQDCIKVRTLLI